MSGMVLLDEDEYREALEQARQDERNRTLADALMALRAVHSIFLTEAVSERQALDMGIRAVSRLQAETEAGE